MNLNTLILFIFSVTLFFLNIKFYQDSIEFIQSSNKNSDSILFSQLKEFSRSLETIQQKLEKKIDSKIIYDQPEMKTTSSPTTSSTSLIKKKSIQKTGQTKYVIYECLPYCGGLADRLKGIMSAYALSLILNRSFVIYQKEPCGFNELIDSNHIKWDIDLKYQDYKNIFDTHKLDIYFDFDVLEWYKHFDFLSAPFKKYLVINGNCMYMNSFRENKDLIDRIKELGYSLDKFNMYNQFHSWYKLLFKLPEQLKVKTDELLLKLKPNKNRSKLICVQIRIGQLTAGNEWDGYFINKNQTNLFWEFVRETFFTDERYKNNSKIFLTTDNEDVKLEGEKEFGNEILYYTKNSSFHLERDVKDDEGKQRDINLFRNVIFDFNFLQYCDAGVVSHSGFGILGLINRPSPYQDLYIYTLENQEVLKKDFWKRKNEKFIFKKINNALKDVFIK